MDCAHPRFRLNMHLSCLGLSAPHPMHRRCQRPGEKGRLDIKMATGIARLMGEVHVAFDNFIDYLGFEPIRMNHSHYFRLRWVLLLWEDLSFPPSLLVLFLSHWMMFVDYCYIMWASGKGSLFGSNSAHLQRGKSDLMGAKMSLVTSSEEWAGSAASGFNLCFSSYSC